MAELHEQEALRLLRRILDTNWGHMRPGLAREGQCMACAGWNYHHHELCPIADAEAALRRWELGGAMETLR